MEVSQDIILETRGLTKEFKGFVAVRNVNLAVKRGTIHALIGPNGAGKTTGIGREGIGRIAALIRSAAANRTVLMVEHNLSVVADLSNIITVLQRGEVLAEGSYAEVSNNPQVVSAYMGTGHGAH